MVDKFSVPNKFPEPSDNQVIIVDGFGFKYSDASDLYPATLLEGLGFLESLGRTSFYDADVNILERPMVYRLPDNWEIQHLYHGETFSISNKLHHTYDAFGKSPFGLFTVSYKRVGEYDLTIAADDLLRRSGVLALAKGWSFPFGIGRNRYEAFHKKAQELLCDYFRTGNSPLDKYADYPRMSGYNLRIKP